MEYEVEEIVALEKPSLLGMITNPLQQFHRIRSNPKIIIALIVVTIMTMIAVLFSLEGMDGELAEEFIGFSEAELVVIKVIIQIITIILAMIAPVLIILISAAVYLLIAKIAGRNVTFKQMFSLFTYLMFISTVGGIINAFYIFITKTSNPDMVITSLNGLMQADGVLGLIYTSIEIFSIWGIILTAIGLQVVAKFPKALAWGVVIGFNLIILVAGIMLTVISESIII